MREPYACEKVLCGVAKILNFPEKNRASKSSWWYEVNMVISSDIGSYTEYKKFIRVYLPYDGDIYQKVQWEWLGISNG